MRLEFARPLNDRLLLVRPNGMQYGHLALEILMGLAKARADRTDVCFLTSGHVVSPPLLELESSEVRIVRPASVVRWWLRGRWWAAEVPEAAVVRRDAALEALYHETGNELSRHIVDESVPSDLRGLLRGLRLRIADRERRVRAERAISKPYFLRRLIVDPVPVSLRPRFGDRARAALLELGIPADARLVTIHAREAGFKRGMEVHEKHERLGKSWHRDDGTRNSRIDSYIPAVEHLASRGYRIVRIGDPTMTPLRHPAVVDLATSPSRSQAVEVECLLRSEFVLSGEAGPVGVSYLTNTPVLNVNVTDPISSYPVRKTGLYLLKHVVDVETRRELSAWDMLAVDYLSHVRDTARYRYQDNTSDEILAAVVEMLELLQGRMDETSVQRDYRQRATQAGEELTAELPFVRKWGPDDGFLGHGRMARICFDRAA